jgi:hypothetical protein
MDWHFELQDAVHEALDLINGWDLARSFEQLECFGEIPIFRSVADAELFGAARRGVVEGLLNNNPEAPAVPIREFWDVFPDFPGPIHQGRCYHVHDGGPPDPPSCQIQEFVSMLQYLLEGRG